LIITKGRELMDCKASKPCLLVIDGDYFGKHALQGGAFLSLSILLFASLKKKKIIIIIIYFLLFIVTVHQYCSFGP
jgi:hypothetical protein